ncbi:acriflavin resistance protein [Salinisphaera orenii MK-B5]|uniref:Acriflavin resistance protein n=1 Tax=Salinisphaera orenii MK-B5 TaxID=856730 RepID=A0A423PWJ1_9GAMM|nr:efflux RND transporter permease subunit [Salinisphaera orenii]ROO29882.1 acriflavin resistance protein [Salinisphaera orenii MK-B5]
MFEALMRRGTLITITVLLICLFGVLAAMRIPVQMIPDLAVRTITVNTSWAGATPQDIENEILIEQEEYLANIIGLQRMTAEAKTGEAEIELEFPFSTDINEALIRVTNALMQVPSYPEDVDEPEVIAASFSQNSFMYFNVAPLEGNPAGLDMAFMRDFVDDSIRRRMERVEGVADVEVGGGAERQIRIAVDPSQLAARGIGLADVRDAIRERNQDFSGGDMDAGKRRYLIRTVGRFEDISGLSEVVLEREGDAVTTLGDVARIRLDHAEQRQLSFFNDEEVVNLQVRRQPGSNVIDIKNDMAAAVEGINARIAEPAGMRLALTSDDVRYVEASIASVWRNLALGAVLAAIVMFLFLRSLPATLITVLGIPVCAIAAFIGLLIFGRTINVISLAGIAFAIGMTLDNTIVVLENIERERRRGRSRWDAAVAGVREVWPAVLASTLTTVMVFAPVLFITEKAGQLYSDISIAIAAAILTSMVVAIMVVPAAAARVLPRQVSDVDAAPGRFSRGVLALAGWIVARRMRRWGTMLSIAGALGLGVYALTPPAEYLPDGEEAKTFSTMLPPPGYNLTEMAGIAEELRADLLDYVVDEDGDIAADDNAVPPIAYMNMSVSTNELRIISEPVDDGDLAALMRAFNERFEAYPGMRAFSTRGSIISSNDGGTRAINLDISAPELADIYAVAETAYDRAETVFDNPQLLAEPSTLTLAQPLLRVEPDYPRIAELGLDAESIGYAVSALVDGAYVDEYFFADDKVDIYLYDDGGKPDAVDALSRLPIYTPEAGVLPLTALARVEPTVDTDVIRRLDSRRTVTLRIIPPEDVPLEAGVDRVMSDIIGEMRDAGEIPSSVDIDISGASDELEVTRNALTGNYIVALLVCYLLLVAIFSHWGYPLLILTSVPLGIAGGIVGLWLLNALGSWLPVIGIGALSQPFDLITMLGFLILVGTVVNNPILIVERARANAAGGMAAADAVVEAVQVRLRPILMTTITTTFGLAPLVFLPGAGTELYRGLGAIVMFGLLFTMFTTVTFLPAMLTGVLRWRERRFAAS